MNKKVLKVGEAAEILGVSVITLQRWDRSGKLKARRTVTNRRFYLYEDVMKLLDGK